MSLSNGAAVSTPGAVGNRREALGVRIQRRLRRTLMDLYPHSPLARLGFQQVISGELARETAAVAAGQVRYAQDHKAILGSYVLLRRNIHRLEKGMVMRPRRAVFAADYIGSTVGIYRKALKGAGDPSAPEIRWATDVLAEYFRVVDRTHPAIAKAFARFSEVQPESRGIECVPYRRKLDEPLPVTFDDFMALSRRRRSVRWFEDRPVSRELIDQAVEAAGQAPSACNRQPFVFRVFDEKTRAREIASIPGGTKGFSQDVQCVAVIVGRLRYYPLERDRHAIYVDGALAAMSFMFALESLGLSSCPINWPDLEPDETRMRQALDLEPDERVVMLVAFGWPDPEGLVPYSAKRPLSELRQYG